MYRKNIFINKIIVFKRWENSAWSIFSSIGKQIRIAVLPVSYIMFSFLGVNAQTDTVQIEDVQITSSRIPMLSSETARVYYVIDKEDIKATPVHSLQDLLEYASNIDVRQRGAEGMQADVSIRGGNFEQTLILLNGFKMNDAQTGHHNLNLPIDIESIEKVEILQGPGNRVFGINSYSGAINFITNSQKAKELKLSLFAGQHKYFGGTASISYNYKIWHNCFSVSTKKSNGYLADDGINNTDFNTLNVFYETSLKHRIAEYIIMAGYSDKSFGANSFYTPKFPWQYENTKTIFAGYKTLRKGKKYNFEKSFYWKRHQDRFELFREDKYKRTGKYFIDNQDTAKYYKGIYDSWNYYPGHNYHRTNLISSIIKFNFKSVIGRSAIGAEYRHVYIKSNVLGNEMDEPINVLFDDFGEYTKEANRFNINMYAEQLYKKNNFMIAAGISSNYNSDYKWNYAGGIDASYDLYNGVKLFASANQALRLPTFTDLYYDGPTNKGNPNLLPETSLTYELGVKQNKKNGSARLTVFNRIGKNTIDWVRLSDTIDWQPQNITELNTFGIEYSSAYFFEKGSFFKKISGSYSYINITKQSSEYISKYALDYLKHKANLSFQHKIYGNISASWNFRYEDRNGTYSAYSLKTNTYTGEQEYEPISLIDLKIFWQNGYLEIFSEANNLLNTQYYEFGNIKMPGLWIKGGVKIKLKLSKENNKRL